jgi:hypothetical protein
VIEKIGMVVDGAGVVVVAQLAAFGHIQPFAALVLALGGWVVSSFALYALLAFVRPETCDRSKD